MSFEYSISVAIYGFQLNYNNKMDTRLTRFDDEYWRIVTEFLSTCDSYQVHEYAMAHNYEMPADGLWRIIKNSESDLGTIHTVFWLTASSLLLASYPPEEQEIAKYILENHLMYENQRFSSKVNKVVLTKLIDRGFNIPLILSEDLSGESVGFPVHTYEGLPREVNDQINQLKQAIKFRRKLP